MTVSGEFKACRRVSWYIQPQAAVVLPALLPPHLLQSISALLPSSCWSPELHPEDVSVMTEPWSPVVVTPSPASPVSSFQLPGPVVHTNQSYHLTPCSSSPPRMATAHLKLVHPKIRDPSFPLMSIVTLAHPSLFHSTLEYSVFVEIYFDSLNNGVQCTLGDVDELLMLCVRAW